jgi:cell division transport system ATP-binding protein
MIEFFNVDLSFDDKQVLSDITFRINKGEFVYLTGPSGAGKSSILRLIYFESLPDAGTVVVNDYSSAKIRFKDIPYLRRTLGVVFQDFKLLTDRSVFDNIALALRIIGLKGADIRKRVLRVLTEVGLGHKRNKYPQELAGGEQQRVAIARALVNDPFILLADEPTGNLDPETGFGILQLLEKINRRGTAILMATHNYDLIRKAPHRTLVLKQGNLKRL